MRKEIQLTVVFFRSRTGNEPVREWLKSLPLEDRKIIGEDIKTVQFGWPLGMPVVRKLEPGLWEVRSRLKNGVARVIFTAEESCSESCEGCLNSLSTLPLFGDAPN